MWSPFVMGVPHVVISLPADLLRKQPRYTPQPMARALDAKTTAELTEAVRQLEVCSCAEVVVEVRGRSGSYAHAHARFAALIAFVVLLALLFSPWPFAPWWVAVDVAIAYGVAAFVARRSDGVRRLVTTRRERGNAVQAMAAAVFHDRGVANTSAETGVLVYLSLLERRIELLADRGVLSVVPVLEWNQLVEAARARHATTAMLLEIVRGLQPLLARHLPIREGDRDELCNVPRFVSE
ncbi:MAG TPA: hypothetical protein VF824_14285 [Thermoanaerobaculia bacterium]